MSHKNSRSSLARNDEFDHSSSSAVTGKRNRSQSSSSSARKEHLRKSDRGENAIEVDEDGVRPKLFVADKDDLASIVTGTFAITGAQQAKWTNMPMDAQALCVKAIVRMLVMKGARNEIVSRAQIIDSLAVIDPNYKKHVDVVLSESQKVLVEVFGYTLTSGDEVREADGKKESLYVSNAVKSPALLATLSELADDDAAFTGFAFVIFQILFTSPAKTADSKSILQKLRKIDNRFPETLLGRGKGNSVAKRANPVPELKEDFLGLMDQMKRWGEMCEERISLLNIRRQVREVDLKNENQSEREE